ncbi:hypothetical protein D0T08_21205 [Emticicia sp. C21]|nr:hypothetical protein D0T08_21205 [Emticicia sp. C21]
MLKGGFLNILRGIIAIKRQWVTIEVAFGGIFIWLCKIRNFLKRNKSFVIVNKTIRVILW